MKKAKDNVDAHATPVQALHKRTKSKKVASISRLNSRLQARSAKGKPQSANVDARGSALDFPRQKEVQVEPKRDELKKSPRSEIYEKLKKSPPL